LTVKGETKRPVESFAAESAGKSQIKTARLKKQAAATTSNAKTRGGRHMGNLGRSKRRPYRYKTTIAGVTKGEEHRRHRLCHESRKQRRDTRIMILALRVSRRLNCLEGAQEIQEFLLLVGA
jgi:hypothetical protein